MLFVRPANHLRSRPHPTMIVTEPAIEAKFGRTLRRRVLAAFLKQAAEAAQLRGEVSVLLTTDDQIRELNHRFRRKNKPTDVLSFPASAVLAGGERVAGDLAISVETAARQAEEAEHRLTAELQILILHGVLHLAGYDHETDSGQMARREASLRKRLGLLNAGLIERTTQSRRTRRSAATGRSERATPQSAPAVSRTRRP